MNQARAPDNHVHIDYIDTLRGLAIGLVFLFHAFGRWPTLVPYGNNYSWFPLIEYGWLGVQLFFMISGFVIYMTIEHTQRMSDYVINRWLRLFPAMLIVSITILVSAPLFPGRPAGVPDVLDAIPGLLFVEPNIIGFILNRNQSVLEGAFWSLFVEVKFYLLFGYFYFKFGAASAKKIIFGAFSLGVIAYFLAENLNSENARIISHVFNDAFSFDHFIWFLLGIVSYDYYRGRLWRDLFSLVAISLLAITFTSLRHTGQLTVHFCILIIAAFVFPIFFRNLYSSPLMTPLSLLGTISYPFYLCHENILIASIINLAKTFPGIPHLLLPTIPFILIFLISYLIAKKGEPYIKSILIKTYSKYDFFIKISLRKPSPRRTKN